MPTKENRVWVVGQLVHERVQMKPIEKNSFQSTAPGAKLCNSRFGAIAIVRYGVQNMDTFPWA